MTQQTESLTPNDSLALINSMIGQAKNRFNENGFLYLLWGWLILICSLGHFIFLKFQMFEHPEIIWASTWLAVIFQIIYLSRQQKRKKVKTYSDNIISAIWISFAACAFVIAIIVGKANVWYIMNSLVLVLYGVPTVLSGVVMRFKPLIIGGIICWCLAILSVFVPQLYVLLLLSSAVIAAWIIPGYLLKAKFNIENKPI